MEEEDTATEGNTHASRVGGWLCGLRCAALLCSAVRSCLTFARICRLRLWLLDRCNGVDPREQIGQAHRGQREGTDGG